MSLDEMLFHFALRGWKRMQKKSILKSHTGMGFSVRKNAESLSYLASALSNEAIKIGFTEHWFAWDQKKIYCPETLYLSNDEETIRLILLLQIAKLSLARRISFRKRSEDRLRIARDIFLDLETQCYGAFSGFSQLKRDLITKLKAEHQPHLEALCKLENNRNILRLWGLCPVGIDDQTGRLPEVDSELLPLLIAPLDPSIGIQALPSGELDESYQYATGKEKLFKPKENVQLVQLQKKPDDESPLVHNFEKLLTADDYKGGHKPIDGEDQLGEHQEALQDLNLTQMVRTPEETKGILKSDLMVNFDIADAEEPDVTTKAFKYDEWNHKTQSYRRKWCWVSNIDFEVPATEQNLARKLILNKAKIEALKKEFRLIHNRRTLKRRVRDGQDIDLDSAVDHYISLETESQIDDRCDISRPNQEKDVAILILMDLSLSTDGWTNNHRVIDLCKDAIGVLGEVLSPFHPLYSVYGFCSHTHRDCRFLKIKGEKEDWRKGTERLAAIRPMGYTRMGPAIRHASYILRKSKARKKLLLIVGDGKPNDYDQYEGQYGIYDVRQAVLEALHLGINTQCIAIDKSEKSYLNIMFSRGNYHLLTSPLRLAETLSKIFRLALFGR